MLGVGAAALLLSAPAQTYGFAVFIDPMVAEFGWSRSLISAAYTFATLGSAVAILLGGRLIDRHGQRRVMAVAAVVYVAALVAMGAVNGLVGLLVGFTLLRVSGASVFTLAARTLVQQWFVRRRGWAASLVNLGKMLGMAAAPPIGAVLIQELGWRAAWQAIAVIVALFVPLVLLVVRNRPEEIGQLPDGGWVDGDAAPATTAEPRSWTPRQARRTAAFWLLLAGTIVPAAVTNGLSFNQVSILTGAGLSPAVAATAFTVESVVALPMTLLAGRLADRVGARYVLAFGQATLAAAMLWLLVTDSTATALVYGGLRGLSSGTWILASEVAWSAYFGRRHLGAIMGLSFAAAFVGAAVGPLPFGLIYDAVGSYEPAIWGLAILPAATTWAALLARPPAPYPDAAS
jgi:MFS family permease